MVSFDKYNIMKIQSYLSFSGDCQQALNFYKGVFGGEINNVQTYEDQKIDIPQNYRQKWQHAELKGKGFEFMAYDVSPDTPLNEGNKICMSIDCHNEQEGHDIFEKLAAQGKTHTNWQEMSWGAKYGRCTDQYGVQWMVNSK
jgi:PhnB protein